MSAADVIGSLISSGLPSNPAGQTRIQLIIGVAVSVDWVAQTCVVNLPDGGSATARMAGDPPVVGQKVYLLLVGESSLTIGRIPLPPMGTVAGAPASGLVAVTADDGVTYQMGFQTSYTPAVGHRVLLDWDAGGHIINRVDAAPPVVVPPVQGGDQGQVVKSQQFNPIDSASFRSSWSSGVVYFGQSYPSAGWFYGTQIADTIPDDAAITDVHVYLEVTAASGLATMPLYLHTSATRPGGSLSLQESQDIGAMPNGFRGDITLPNTWGDLLKTGARFGVGTAGAGYRRLNGPAQNPVAGAITITWTE